MGGKKKTKWRKLPLGELTHGTARGSTVSGSLREQIEDGLHGNGFSNLHHYDAKSDELQWKETRQAGYYAQGPPHLYTSSAASQVQDDVNQEETVEGEEKPGMVFNGFWIPDSDLDQFNIINGSSAYEPFYRQMPVLFCPPVMPYCSAPYSHLRNAYPSNAPFFPNFCIPSDPHYYYYLTRPRTINKDEEQPFEREAENVSPPSVTDDISDEVRHQQEPNCDDAENQPAPLLPEVTTETALPYPYPGYTFGEPVYSVPVYPLLPPTQRVFPRPPWSATQTQRKRRRKRKEYNADYAVIPAPKNPSQGNTGTESKSDLGITRDETTCNNEVCGQPKGNDTHSVPVTGSSPFNKETKQNDCVLNNQENDDAESAYLSHKKATTKDAANLVECITRTAHQEFSKNINCETINNRTIGFRSVLSPETEVDSLVAEILNELIQEVVNESPQDLPEQCRNRKGTSNCQSIHQETGNDAIEFLGNSDDNSVYSVACERRSAHSEMENILRKNQNPNFPEVHKKVQSDLDIENTRSYTTSQNYYSNDVSDDSFVQNENRKNLSQGKPVHLSKNEGNKFFDVSLVHEETNAVVPIKEGSFVETGRDLQTSVNSTIEQEDNVSENKQSEVQDALRTQEQGDLFSPNVTLEKQSVSSLEKHKARTPCQTDLENTSEYLEFRTGTSGVTNPSKEDDEAKNCEDSLDSLTSNESCRDRDKQLLDSHRSSPHSFLSFVTNSEALIRETELELSKIQQLTSRPPLQANQSIYKFAFDENLTDQSETEDTTTPIPSPLPELSRGKDSDADDAAVTAEMRQDVQRSEIVVHEGDSGSEAGSEDVELLPHRYESQGGDKHLYVNKLSLAVELLRTHEKLPYDEEFKRVVDDEGESVQCGKGNVVSSKSRSNKAADVSSGTVNPAFVGDSSPKIQNPVEISPQVNDRNARPVFERSPAPIRNLQEVELVQHRHSRISTADSGVQSEDSGDEMGEEAKERYGRLGFTESEEQELWNPADEATMAYRRFGAHAPQRFNIFTPRAGGLNPCFCCVIM